MIQYSIKVPSIVIQIRNTTQERMVSSYVIQMREWNRVMIQLSVEQIGGWFVAGCNHLTHWKDYAMQCNAVTDGRAPSASAK